MKITTNLLVFLLSFFVLNSSTPSYGQTSNQALNFDGFDDIATIPNNAAYNVATGNFTMEAWVKLNGLQTTFPTVLSKRDANNASSGFLIMIYQSKILFQIGGINVGSGVATVQDGTCHHIAIVRNGTTVYYYVDGLLDATFTNIAQSINTTHPLWVGRDEFSLNNTLFKGTIGEVRYWNIARTQAQISGSLHSFLTGTESGLKGYWRMNDGSGQTFNDYTTLNNDGYLGSSVNVDATDPTYVQPGCLVICTPPPAVITSNGTNICTASSILLSANTGAGYTYQWRLNSNVIAGATSSTYSATAIGSYICQVTSNGCTNNSNTITLTSSSPSVTITYSLPTTICSGSSKLLTASVSGAGTSPTYQWKLGGNNISGATASTYNATQAGVYTVTVTNTQSGCTGTSSNSVTLTVTSGAPAAAITTSGNTTSCYSVFLTATPTGSGITFQWQRNSVNISGATSSTYFAQQSGTYRCVVTNSCGSSNSNTLVITLTGTGPITYSGNTSFCSGNLLMYAPVFSNATYQWTNNGIDIPGAVYSSYATSTAGNFSCRIGTATCGFVNATNSVVVLAPAAILATGATEVCTGPVTLNAFPSSGATYQWKLNGANITGATASTYSAANSGTYSCTVTTTLCGATTSNSIPVTLGVPTQVTLVPPSGGSWNYDFCGTTAELTALPANAGTYNWYNDPSGIPSPYYSSTDNEFYPITGMWYVELVTACGTTSSAVVSVRDINVPLTIDISSASNVICSPGSTPIDLYVSYWYNMSPQWDTYQWKLNGANISGANGPSYYPTLTGYYSCTVTNSCGTACCVDSALITVLSAPNNTVTASGPLTFCQGQSVTLSVPNVAGNTYQWYRNNTSLGLTTNSMVATTAGTYKVRITNACTSVYSADQVVTLTQPITATVQANNPTINCSGNPIILSASTGTGYIYEWYKNNVVIPGATTSNYNTSVTGNYHVKISTSNLCFNTSNVMLVVLGNASAAITSSTTMPVCESGNVYLISNATGSGNTYQWKFNGVSIPNITSSSYTFNPTATGNYTVDVTNLCGTFTSPPFTVTVNPGPPALITPAGPTTFCAPASVVLNANTGSGITYQWYGPSGLISGATSSSYTATLSGNYSVREAFTSSGCLKNSPIVVINAANTAATISPAGPISQCNGSVLLTANTGAGFTYQWKKNGSNIAGATSSTYTATTTGNYTVSITNSCGTITSAITGISIYTASPSATITVGTIPTCSGPYATAYLSTSFVSGHTYQWKRNGTNISGATTYGYNAALNGNYTCVISNTCSTVTSNTIAINMTAPPTATITAAGSVNLCQGNTVVLNANTGTGLTYQWRNNGVNIIGATSASYTASTGGTYSCYVTNSTGCGQASNNLNVFVTTNTATITPAGSNNICANTALMLTANLGGTSYQWKLNGVNITGATSSSYNATAAGSYTVVVTSSCGSVTSAATVITVINNPTPTITAGGPTTFCAGQSVVFTANNYAGVAYKWQKNNVTISGATAQTYTATTAGAYRVKETFNGCSKFSTSITVVVNCRIADPNYIKNDVPVMTLQPNPFNEQAELILSPEIDLVNAEIEIYDMTGKLINRITVIDEYTVKIYKGNMLPGLYLLMLKSSGSLTDQLKFIVE